MNFLFHLYLNRWVPILGWSNLESIYLEVTFTSFTNRDHHGSVKHSPRSVWLSCEKNYWAMSCEKTVVRYMLWRCKQFDWNKYKTYHISSFKTYENALYFISEKQKSKSRAQCAFKTVLRQAAASKRAHSNLTFLVDFQLFGNINTFQKLKPNTGSE